MQQGSEDWQPLHPLSPLMRAGRMIILVGVIATQSLDVFLEGGFLSFITVFVAIVVSSIYGFIAWLFIRYRIHAEHIELREGVLFRSQKRAPLARLETVDIIRPAIARIFGLAEVRVELAGLKGSELRLKYLSESDAIRIRDQLLSHQRPLSPQDVEVPPGYEVFKPREREVVIAAVETDELVLGLAATRLGLPFVLFVFAAIVTAAFSLEAAAFLPIAFFGVGVAVLFALAAEVERSWNFTLSESETGFVIHRGLFNLLTQKVPLHRVQAVSVVTPLFWRPFNRSKLLVDIAGYGDDVLDNQNTSLLLPIGGPGAVRAILKKVFPDLDLDSVQFEPPPSSARWRAPFFWRTYGVSWTPAYSFTRSGYFWQNIDIVPHRKVQSLRITEGPWERRLGLASLHVDSAGTSVTSVAKHRNPEELRKLAQASRTADAAH